MTDRSGLIGSLRGAGRLALPFFVSEERWPARALLAGVFAAELALVAVAVAMNHWRNAFFQALQEKNWDAFLAQFWIFGLIGVGLILSTVYQQYLTQWLSIRWRRWMTERALAGWLDGPTHYRMQLGRQGVDNPDQRIAEDVRRFIDLVLSLTTGLLGAVAKFVSFVAILWGLSRIAPLTLFGETYAVPGYLVWAALIYAMLGTAIAHLIGRRLIPLNYEQERREADFRFALVRLRENAEAVALLRGEPVERDLLRGRFAAIVENWHRLMQRQKLLTFFTAGYRHYSLYFPYLVVGPLYFSGGMALGALMQAGSAFNEVRAAFSFFVTAYPKIAEFTAVVQRLSGFEAAIAAMQGGFTADRGAGQAGALSVRDLSVREPDGAGILARLPALDVARGEHVLLTGPSGAGKTTLLRAIGGIWPQASGTVSIDVPGVMVLSQRPYFPLGSLRHALAFPRPAETFTDDEVGMALRQAGLSALTARLDETAPWARQLSDGEQQRLALARALLHRPDLLLLDEATAALDEPAEDALHRLLHSALPDATILAVSHRRALQPLYDRTVTIGPA